MFRVSTRWSWSLWSYLRLELTSDNYSSVPVLVKEQAARIGLIRVGHTISHRGVRSLDKKHGYQILKLRYIQQTTNITRIEIVQEWTPSFPILDIAQ